MNNNPFVTLIIPCHDEEKYIKKCLDSMMRQTYPKESLEIFVVDGMSLDKTREIAKSYPKPVEILDNPKKLFAAAVNIGIKKAKGDLIMILGAHAAYPDDYVQQCAKYSMKYDADNTGGKIIATPRNDTFIAKAITLSLGGRFGKSKEGDGKIKWKDTVFGGCYKKRVFEKIGLFNEKLEGSSDMDFNARLIRSGGKILFVPEIVVLYYPKDNLKDFFIHNIRDGIWAVLPIKFTGRPMKLRHYFPLILVLTLPISIWPYIIAALYYSFGIALKEKNSKYFFVMPLVFFIRHIGYGIGSLIGILKIIF